MQDEEKTKPKTHDNIRITAPQLKYDMSPPKKNGGKEEPNVVFSKIVTIILLTKKNNVCTSSTDL